MHQENTVHCIQKSTGKKPHIYIHHHFLAIDKMILNKIARFKIKFYLQIDILSHITPFDKIFF